MSLHFYLCTSFSPHAIYAFIKTPFLFPLFGSLINITVNLMGRNYDLVYFMVYCTHFSWFSLWLCASSLMVAINSFVQNVTKIYMYVLWGKELQSLFKTFIRTWFKWLLSLESL